MGTATDDRITSLLARGYHLTVEPFNGKRVMVRARHERGGTEEFAIGLSLAAAVDGVSLCIDRTEEAKDRR